MRRRRIHVLIMLMPCVPTFECRRQQPNGEEILDALHYSAPAAAACFVHCRVKSKADDLYQNSTKNATT